MKYIQLGDQGRDVEVWQRFLAHIWLLELDQTLPGHFNDATHEATLAYQVECGMEPTGIVDRATIEAATDRGLNLIDDQVFKGPSGGFILVSISAFILVILVSQCMLMPDGGQTMQGVQLPISPTLIPSSPPPRPCPGWFC